MANDQKRIQLRTEEIHLKPGQHSGYRVITRVNGRKWSTEDEALFTLNLHQYGERSRKREKHIEELRTEARASIIAFCEEIISTLKKPITTL